MCNHRELAEKSRVRGHGFLLLLRREHGALNLFCPFCRRDDFAPVTWGCIDNYHEIIDHTSRVT